MAARRWTAAVEHRSRPFDDESCLVGAFRSILDDPQRMEQELRLPFGAPALCPGLTAHVARSFPPTQGMIMTRFSSLALAVFLAACTDVLPLSLDGERAPPPAGAVLVECRVDVSAASMSCAPAPPAPGSGPRMDLILGGQNTYVRLANGVASVGADSFSIPVTVQNLTAQAMGTADGTTVSSRGVRVFFQSGPTNGVQVANSDGEAMYTGSAQPYFQYGGILQPQQVSAPKTWSFVLNQATSFSFQVYVVAEVPSATGLLRMQQVEGTLTTGWLSAVWMEGSTAVAVGHDAGGTVIVRSTDGGGTWARASGGTSAQSSLGVGGDGSAVVAVGTGGDILRSTDGGDTWSVATSGTTDWLHDVSGEGSTFVAVGWGGLILRSTDGGATWGSVTSGTT
jgi:hypothetical protein